MIEKCKVLYKGDMIAGIVYIIVGFFLLVFASILHIFTISPGYLYLSYGFFMFFFILHRQRYSDVHYVFEEIQSLQKY